eukprot:scaffold42416_cov15-Tisochrysis_lutea.AAC.1
MDIQGAAARGRKGQKNTINTSLCKVRAGGQVPGQEVTVPDGKPDAKPEELLKPVTNKVTQVRCSAAQRLG